MTNTKRKIPVKRIFKIAAITFAGLLVLLLLSLAFLPTLVSNQTLQSRIQQTLSSSMKRQVAWSGLVMTWKNGINLSGFRLGAGSAPLLKADIGQIVIDPGFGYGADGRFGIDLAIKVRDVKAELAPGLPKPPPEKTLKDPLTMLAELIQKLQDIDLPLPVDLRVVIDVAPLKLSYQMPGRHLRLNDFSLLLQLPSLATKPITAEVKGLLALDGREMGKVSLNAKISDLVNKGGRIRLAQALFAAQASAPGASFALSGGLSQADGFVARSKLDIPKLLAVADPFVPKTVPQLAGNIELMLQAKNDERRNLRATVALDGTKLAAAGGALKAGRAGSFDLRLRQRISTDRAGQLVEFPGGTFAIPGLVDAAWSAAVRNPTLPERSLEVSFGPLRLDLAKAFSVAAPLIPPASPLKELAGEVTLRSLNLHLKGPGNIGDVAMAGLAVNLPKVRLALKNGELTAENLEILLEKVACPLAAKLPTKLSAELLWNIKRVALSGAQPLALQGARGTVGVKVSELNLKSASPRKIAASVLLDQTVDVDRIALGTKITVEKLHEQLRLQARAAENGEIFADLPDFAVTASSLRGIQSGKKYGPIPLSASLTAAGLHLAVGKGVKPTLQQGAAIISAGDFAKIDAAISLSGQGRQLAKTKGRARLDLKRAMPFAAPFAPAGLKAGGVLSAAWDLAAMLPEKQFALDNHPLRKARAALAQFEKLELGLNLDNVSATVPSAKGTINIAGLRTKPDLRIVFGNKGESARLDGGILFSGISGLPGAAGKLPIQRGSLLFGGELTGWNELRLNQELRIDPLGVAQEAELNVSRLDALMEEKQPFSSGTLIKRLDATLFSTVDAAFPRELQQLLPGLEIAGNVSSGVRVDLSGGHELALSYSLKTRDFDVQLAGGTKVEGLRSNILLNRVYALAASKGEGWTPLSSALVRPPALSGANPGAAEIVGRINDDLRGDVGGKRSFSIRRVTTKASGVPLVLTALEGDLLFGQEKSGLSFFQADLLGGTLLASGILDLRPEIPRVVAASSFSNLDVTRLLPKEARQKGIDEDAEITGEASLSVPLTPEQRELLEQLRLTVNVRKIGANTIERALFSLDPFERNEQLVAQRKMLRLGTLKGLRANAVDGAFSMEGEALIKGVAVTLPKVDRLRISELPQRQELVKSRKGIMALRGILDLVRADTLVVGPKGELSLKRRNYAQ